VTAGRDRGEVTLRGLIIVAVLGVLAAGAVVVYRAMGPEAVLDGAEAGLKSGDWETRKKTVEGIYGFVDEGRFSDSPGDDERARGLIVSALADSNDEVRRAAATACQNLREKSAIEPLKKILSTKGDLKLRVGAARALGAIGDGDAGGTLRDVMEDSDEPEDLRAAAIDALGTCGGVASIAPLLRQRLSGSETISAHAQLALTKIRSRSTVLSLYGFSGQVGHLNTQLGKMNKAIEENQQALDRMLDETDGVAPTRAGPLSGLYAKLDSKQADVRLSAVYDLELLRRKESVFELAGMLDDKDGDVSKAARGALVKIVGSDLGAEKAPWQNWHAKNVKK